MDNKSALTAILSIIADATKLSPMLVFKGQPEGRVENKIKTSSNTKPENICLLSKKNLE